MLFSTNSLKRPALGEEKKKRVFTTTNTKPRPLPVFPVRDFPGVNKVQQKKPAKTFIQTSDLEDMRRKFALEAEMKEIKAANAEKPKRAYKKAAPRKKRT